MRFKSCIMYIILSGTTPYLGRFYVFLVIYQLHFLWTFKNIIEIVPPTWWLIATSMHDATKKSRLIFNNDGWIIPKSFLKVQNSSSSIDSME